MHPPTRRKEASRNKGLVAASEPQSHKQKLPRRNSILKKQRTLLAIFDSCIILVLINDSSRLKNNDKHAWRAIRQSIWESVQGAPKAVACEAKNT
jgi:hypothetical protein